MNLGRVNTDGNARPSITNKLIMQDSVLTVGEEQKESATDGHSEMPVAFQTPKIAENDETKQKEEVAHTDKVSVQARSAYQIEDIKVGLFRVQGEGSYKYVEKIESKVNRALHGRLPKDSFYLTKARIAALIQDSSISSDQAKVAEASIEKDTGMALQVESEK